MIGNDELVMASTRALIVTALALLAVAGCSSEPDMMTVRGELELDSSGMWTVSAPTSDGTKAECAGTGGYSDVAVGAPVRVFDETGQQVALGQVSSAHTSISDATLLAPCRLRWELQVPITEAGQYEVEVSSRGRVPFTRADAEDGTVRLTLGD